MSTERSNLLRIVIAGVLAGAVLTIVGCAPSNTGSSSSASQSNATAQSAPSQSAGSTAASSQESASSSSGTAESASSSESTESASSPSSDATVGVPEVDMDQFEDMMDSISATVREGTAGGSLANAQAAASLLDWTMATNLSADEVQSLSEAYFQGLDEGARAEIVEKLGLVETAIDDLNGDNAEGLASDADLASISNYPWNDTAFEKASRVLAAAQS